MERTQSQFFVLMTMALLVRLFFVQTYYGWEESDYGNLAMVYGVWESGFTHYDMNHMPGYYFVCALLYALVRSSIWAGIGVSILSGMGTLYLVGRCAKDWSTSNAATMVLIGLMVQPEFALYSSSSLREPLYTLYVVLAFQSLVDRRVWMYGLWSALAFSVRFEAPLYMVPMVLMVGWTWKEKGQALSILCSAVGAWMLYCYQVYETPIFWSHAAAVNVETGLSAEGQGVDWWRNGFLIVWGLITQIATSHVGFGLMLAWLATPFVWWRSKNIRLCWIWSFLMTGVWLAIAFVAQHEVGHNLYWKWMYPMVPFWVLCAVFTLVRSCPKWVWWLVMGQALFIQGMESVRQWRLSEQLYGPQIRLAQWMEENIAPTEPLLVDNVPACWLKRDTSSYTLHSWFDVPTFKTPNDLLLWAKIEKVHWVLFFREEWTQAPQKASFMVTEQTEFTLESGQIRLVDEEPHYGWKWYSIEWSE